MISTSEELGLLEEQSALSEEKNQLEVEQLFVPSTDLPSKEVVSLSPEDQRAIAIVEERAPNLQPILNQNSVTLQQIGLLQETQWIEGLLSTAVVRYGNQVGEEVLMLPEMALKILAHEQQITVRDAVTDKQLFDLTPLLTHLSSSHQLLQQERQARLKAEAKIEQVEQKEQRVAQAMLQITEAMLEDAVDSTLSKKMTGLKAALQPRVELEERQPLKQLLPTAAVRNAEDEEASTMLAVAAPVTNNFSREEFETALLSDSGVIVGAFFGVDEPLEIELSSGDRFTIELSRLPKRYAWAAFLTGWDLRKSYC